MPCSHPFKNIVIILSISAFILLFLRETGILNIDFYTNYAEYHMDTKVRESYLSAQYDSTKMEGIADEDVTNTPIVVLYDDDTLIHRAGYGPEIVLTIEDLDTGPIWLPLYKPGQLDARISCAYHGGCTKRIGRYIRGINLDINGTIHVTGTVDIVGICSYRTSRHLMKEAVARISLEQINLRLRDLETRFEGPFGSQKTTSVISDWHSWHSLEIGKR
jgi:hypothetical protein